MTWNLSNTFNELQEMLGKRYEQKRKQARVDLKPLMSAVEAKREVLDDGHNRHAADKQAGELTVQAGKTINRSRGLQSWPAWRLASWWSSP